MYVVIKFGAELNLIVASNLLGMIFSQIPGPKKSGVVHKHLYQKPAMQV